MRSARMENPYQGHRHTYVPGETVSRISSRLAFRGRQGSHHLKHDRATGAVESCPSSRHIKITHLGQARSCTVCTSRAPLHSRRLWPLVHAIGSKPESLRYKQAVMQCNVLGSVACGWPSPLQGATLFASRVSRLWTDSIDTLYYRQARSTCSMYDC